MKGICAAVLAFLIVGTCPVRAGDVSAGGGVPPEEYEVYTAIVPWGGVLVATTAPYQKVAPEDLAPGAAGEGELAAACADFNGKNAGEYRLEAASLKVRGITAITEERRREIFSTIYEGWKEFRRLYGNATLVRVSRVGFNASRTLAVVYRSEVADPEMGQGELLVLERAGSGEPWKVSSEIPLWIS